MQYEDFDLTLEAIDNRTCRLVVLRSPAGEATAEATFPFDETARQLHLTQIENALLRSSGQRRRVPGQHEEAVMRFGKILFDFLMQGEVGQRYAVSQDRCSREGKGLRLRIQDPTLAALPWEFLYDQRFDHYLVLSQRTPLVRYLELPRPLRTMPVTPPLRLLGMIAHPNNLPPLDVAVEKARVEQALAGLQAEGLVELTWLEGQSWRDLQRALRRQQYHLFHFIGHGDFNPQQDEGFLLFADQQGRGQPMSATNLARLLADHPSLRAAILNACEGGQSGGDIFSSTAATLVRSGLPCVVAMQYEISDRAAIEFSRTFYEALADGLPTETAVADARKSIIFSQPDSLEWGTPIIFTHAPDGVLFDIDFTAPQSPAPQPRSPAPTPAAPTPSTHRSQTPPRPALAAPASGVALPHIVGGASPLKLAWCWVPGGTFTMGSNDYDDEKPIHEVAVDGFWLAQHPITNRQYRLFVEAGGYREKQWWTDAGWKQAQQEKWTEPRYWSDKKWNGEQQPVLGVSWYEATAFCRWAAAATGEQIRLPTEAEWEKAARGTDGRIFPWGNNEPTEKLCHFDQDWSTGTTKPVGQHSPQGDSPFGCADMAGNVYDWVADWYQPYPGNNKPNDDYGEEYRVVRGGSWLYGRNHVRCAIRSWYEPQAGVNLVGFRCASTAF